MIFLIMVYWISHKVYLIILISFSSARSLIRHLYPIASIDINIHTCIHAYTEDGASRCRVPFDHHHQLYRTISDAEAL